MNRLRSKRLIAAAVLVTGIAFSISLFAFAAFQPQASQVERAIADGEIDEDVIASALTYAASRGLISTGDPAADRLMVDLAVRLTRQEWENVLANTLHKEAADLGILADLSIAVVVIRGDVDRTRGPGLPNPDVVMPTLYDNIYVVMNPFSKKPLSIVSFKPGVRLPLYDDQSVAGGATAVYRPTLLPESTASVTQP